MSERPNIILVTTDQQRYDTTGPEAPRFMRTPHLDLLAKEGITFRRAYAECPICVPSRVSIMSGLDAATTGHSDFRDSRVTLDRVPTLPTLMRDAGYQTVAIGKMHFGPQRARHGFEEMILPDDYYRHMLRSGHPLQPMRHGLGQNELCPGMATVPEAMTLTSWTAEQGVEYIKYRRDPTRPFFMWLSFSKPHPPLDPPEPYYSMYRNCPIPEPVIGDWCSDERAPYAFLKHRQSWSQDQISFEILREARAAYYGLVTQCDYNLGRVLSALQDEGKGVFANTMILFTTDHGEYLGDHRTGSKIFWHEPSAHIPFILRLPKTWSDRPNDATSDALVTLSDVLPTLVAAAGGKVPEGLDGMDVTSVARRQQEGRTYTFGVGGGDPPIFFAVRDERYKFIHWTAGGTRHLFDLQQDPHELHNLADDPSMREHIHRLTRAIVDRFRGRELGKRLTDALPVQPVPDETKRSGGTIPGRDCTRRSMRWM